MAISFALLTTLPFHEPFSFSFAQTTNLHCKSLKSFTRAARNRTSFLETLDHGLHKSSLAQRKRIFAINKSNGDSNQNSLPDEEVKDLGVRAALSLLKFYKREISPLLPSSCRFVPTCSEYSMEAYKKYGVAKGTILTAWRLCRCNPLGGSGFDPPRWFDERRPLE